LATLLELGASALAGKTPIDRLWELLTPISSCEDVENAYDPARKRIRLANSAGNSTLGRLK
jgi:hypothetical protein